MSSARSSSGNRLTIDDWLQAGYAILAEEGIKTLKIDRLCTRLKVTKGSFYWHFDGMPSYRAALVQGWRDLRDEDRSQIEAIGELPPRERLAQMMASLISPRHWTLERAMREWARTDETVAESVRAADRRVLAAVRTAFEDYGFDTEDAELRANATFAVGIGFLHLSGPDTEPPAGRAERAFPRPDARALNFHTKKYGSVRACRRSTSRRITDEFVAALAQRAAEAEELRRLPEATVADLTASGFTDLLMPARYGGRQAAVPRPAGPGTPDGPRLHLQRLDDRLPRPAQLDAGAVRRAGPGGGLRQRGRSWRRHRWPRPAAACPPTAASGSPDAGPGPPG